MTLGRCPLRILCSRGSPPGVCPCGCDEWKSIEPTNPESIIIEESISTMRGLDQGQQAYAAKKAAKVSKAAKGEVLTLAALLAT